MVYAQILLICLVFNHYLISSLNRVRVRYTEIGRVPCNFKEGNNLMAKLWNRDYAFSQMAMDIETILPATLVQYIYEL